MWFSSWLAKRQRAAPSGRSHKPPRKRPTCRPQLEALEDRWLPSQVGLTVTSLADSGPGTLRAAIQTADAGSPSDKFTIGFSVTGTIDLQSPLADLNNSIAIQGPGATSLTVERAAGFSFASAIVTVDPGQSASLSGITITKGNAGGIVDNGGTLTVANSAVVNNSVGPSLISATPGGGIYNRGASGSATLTVIDSIVSGNTAGQGGGIDNSLGCTLTVTGSIVSGNTAQDGGGILNIGTLTVDRSMVSGNTATGSFSGFPLFHFLGEGGGILNGGTMTVSGSTLCGNAADLGGGIFSDSGSSVNVRDTVFTANSATRGGGIYFGGGALLEVQGSTFSRNTASDSGGAIYNLGTATLQGCSLSKNTAGSAGGGVFNGASGTLAVKDSTVLNNMALLGADLYNLGGLTLDDSTVGVIGP
jgi:predicted outer membrane repeat protein